MVEDPSFLSSLIKEPVYFQIAYYIISPIITFLSVLIAYLAVYKQAKPNVIVHYEPNDNVGSVIDLVICNYGGGTARDVTFSEAIPTGCWGIEAAHKINTSEFLNINIPVLAPGKSLKHQAGQYGGLLSQLNENKPVIANYSYRTPFRRKKKGSDLSILDINYMSRMHSGNSPAYDLADAMKGRNNTVFLKTNAELTKVNINLDRIAAVLETQTKSECENA